MRDSKAHVEKMMRLEAILSRYQTVTRLDAGERKESETLAHAFSDLEESFRKLTDEFFPKLENEELSEQDFFELLHDVGEEFRPKEHRQR